VWAVGNGALRRARWWRWRRRRRQQQRGVGCGGEASRHHSQELGLARRWETRTTNEVRRAVAYLSWQSGTMAKSDGVLQGTLRNGSATFEKQTRGARGLLDHAGMRGPRAEERAISVLFPSC
jgi:hypothetical protein